MTPVDWRPLLFQQFHDILPGTAIPEVFEQAQPTWRRARRRARRQRDAALEGLFGVEIGSGAAAEEAGTQTWVVAQLQPLAAQTPSLRLPAGKWSWASVAGPRSLPQQASAAGGTWVQLPALAGVSSLTLRRQPGTAASGATGAGAASGPEPDGPVRLEPLAGEGGGRWRLANDHLAVSLGPEGIEQLHDAAGRPLLAAPLLWRRWRDAGEFWDAWDLAADHRQHPLPWEWDREPRWLERGPLCGHVVWRGRCGRSPARLEARLLACSPWLELVVSLQWRQRHELLQLELPLAQPACRWASDTGGGVIERPATPRTAAERARWEVAAIAWIAALSAPQAADTPDLAVLLDGPQGVSATAERLNVSLLRAPTWPDPGADNGWQRQRLALMPCPGGWRAAAVPAQARRLREPLWRRPLTAPPRRGGPWLPPLPPDLELVQLRPFPGRPGELLLAVQNNGPCRRRLDLGEPWRLLQRLDGLGQALQPEPEDPAELRPWQLGSWRLGAGLPEG
jgi:alpha-mannosidase